MKNWWWITLFVVFSLGSCSNECEDAECLNGGVCFEGDCDCPIGFSGSNCGSELRAQFIGDFSVTSDCFEESVIVRIRRNNNRGDYLTVNNLANNQIDLLGVAQGNDFSIASQSYLNGTIEGFGSYNPNTGIVLNFTVQNDSSTVTCIAVGQKTML